MSGLPGRFDSLTRTVDHLRVAGSGSEDSHVRAALGLYLLGALKNDECERVERHLAQCADCCMEAYDLGATVEPLAMVAPQYLEDLIAEYRASGPEAQP